MSSVPEDFRENIGSMSEIVQREQEQQLATVEHPLSDGYLFGAFIRNRDDKIEEVYQAAYKYWEDIDPQNRVGKDTELTFVYAWASEQNVAYISQVALRDLIDIESLGSTAEVTYN